VFHVEPGAAEIRVPAVERAAENGTVVCPAAEGIGQNLEALGRGDGPQTHQMAEARGVSGLGFPLERPLAALVLAEHPAEEVYAPHLVARLGEPQLRERDPHLNDPAQRIDRRRDVPSWGSVSVKPPTLLACCHAGSSSLPSSTGGRSIRTAVMTGAARPPA